MSKSLKLVRKSVPAIIDWLDKAYRRGKRWIVYPCDRVLVDIWQCRCFSRFCLAEAACQRSSQANRFFRFRALPDLIKMLRSSFASEKFPVPPRSYRGYLAEEITLKSFQKNEEVFQQLGRGEYLPVRWKRSCSTWEGRKGNVSIISDPLTSIDWLPVIARRHPITQRIDLFDGRLRKLKSPWIKDMCHTSYFDFQSVIHFV